MRLAKGSLRPSVVTVAARREQGLLPGAASYAASGSTRRAIPPRAPELGMQVLPR